MTTSYQELLRDAEWYCSQAETAKKGSSREVRFSTASVLFSFIAIESFINNMMYDFATLPPGMFTPHEQGFLAEKTVELAESGAGAGRFEVTNHRRYWSLENKIMFLVARFGGDTVDKGSTLWQEFVQAKDVRDRLTHPRKGSAVPPSPSDAQTVLDVAKQIVRLVSRHVWGKEVQV